jgi:hypothetical protein
MDLDSLVDRKEFIYILDETYYHIKLIDETYYYYWHFQRESQRLSCQQETRGLLKRKRWLEDMFACGSRKVCPKMPIYYEE